MIEVLNSRNKLIAYIEGTQYLDAKQRLCGYLEGNSAKSKSGASLLSLQDTGTIIDLKEGTRALCRNNKIYHLTAKHLEKLSKMIKKGLLPEETLSALPEPVLAQFPDALLYQFSGNKIQILDSKQRPVLNLKGPPDEIDHLGNLELFGIAALFLHLNKVMKLRVANKGIKSGINRNTLNYWIAIVIIVGILGSLGLWGLFSVMHWYQEHPSEIIPGFEPLLFVLLVICLVGLVLVGMHSRLKAGISVTNAGEPNSS